MIDKLKKIKIFLMDVDGVLTDGKMYYFTDADGKVHEFKGFNSKDGIGLIVLNKLGIMTGIITGRESLDTYERAKILKMSFVYQGFITKLFAAEEILKKTGFSWENVCYMGDDLPDIPVLEKCGFSASPKDAVDDVKKVCDYVSSKNGGDGAVREICDMIIEAKGFIDDMRIGFKSGKWPRKDEFKTETVNVFYSEWKNR